MNVPKRVVTASALANPPVELAPVLVVRERLLAVALASAGPPPAITLADEFMGSVPDGRMAIAESGPSVTPSTSARAKVV